MSKVICITGAGSGIGRATAGLAAAQGHAVVLAGRNVGVLKELASSLGEKVYYQSCDVTDYAQVSRLMADAVAQFGRLDVLVNNAGLGYFEKVEDGSIEQWHRMVDVNVKGVLNCIHAALPRLLQHGGHLVNISSVAGRQVFVNSGIYCATKHAVHAISESLRLELAGRLRVTTISPGAVNTPFVHTTTDEQMKKDYVSYFASGLDAQAVALQIMNAINAPESEVISEIIIRPNRPVK